MVDPGSWTPVQSGSYTGATGPAMRVVPGGLTDWPLAELRRGEAVLDYTGTYFYQQPTNPPSTVSNVYWARLSNGSAKIIGSTSNPAFPGMRVATPNMNDAPDNAIGYEVRTASGDVSPPFYDQRTVRDVLGSYDFWNNWYYGGGWREWTIWINMTFQPCPLSVTFDTSAKQGTPTIGVGFASAANLHYAPDGELQPIHLDITIDIVTPNRPDSPHEVVVSSVVNPTLSSGGGRLTFPVAAHTVSIGPYDNVMVVSLKADVGPPLDDFVSWSGGAQIWGTIPSNDFRWLFIAPDVPPVPPAKTGQVGRGLGLGAEHGRQVYFPGGQ